MFLCKKHLKSLLVDISVYSVSWLLIKIEYWFMFEYIPLIHIKSVVLKTRIYLIIFWLFIFNIFCITDIVSWSITIFCFPFFYILHILIIIWNACLATFRNTCYPWYLAYFSSKSTCTQNCMIFQTSLDTQFCYL